MASFASFLWHWLRDLLLMVYFLCWPLALGFVLSAALQAFAPRRRIEARLGGRGVRPLALATALGGVSSSCSYAAVAVAKTLFQKGASAPSAFAFQLASTNLVAELAAALVALLGPLFLLGELVGGLVMVALLALVLSLLLSRSMEEEGRANAKRAAAGHLHHSAGGEGKAAWRALVGLAGWSDLAHNFRGDLQMLYKEILFGLVGAALLAQVPSHLLADLLLKGGSPPLRIAENIVVGPLLAAATFVCSVGNVAVAAVLWSAGATMPGILAFLFADLLIPPLLSAYRKYYGFRFAARFVLSYYLALLGAALLVYLLFGASGLLGHLHRPSRPALFGSFHPDYNLYLDLLFLLLAAVLFVLTRVLGATDPVCRMRVAKRNALQLQWEGNRYFFCSPHCRDRFAACLAAGDVPPQEVEVASKEGG